MSTLNTDRPDRWFWPALTLSLSVVIAAVDATVLEVTRGAFGNGFGGVLLDTLPLRAGYLAIAALLNAIMALTVWATVLPILQLARQPAHRCVVWCATLALGLAAWSDLLIYHVHTILGTMLTPGIVQELAGATKDQASAIVASVSWASAISWTVLLAALILTILLSGAAIWITDRLATRFPERAQNIPLARSTRLLAGALLLSICALTVLAWPSPFMLRVRPALTSQPSAALFTTVANWVTDIDQDGSGLLSHPPDPAPFDGTRHRFALDSPGNGIDEDALVGDLPVDVPLPMPAPLPAAAPASRPHVLVIYLESFRYDLIGLDRDGTPVTPFFVELARQGARSHQAFVHSPYTVRSRAQLFGGTLTPTAGQRTWIDDFNELGYRTGHFSGQDDSFGESEALLGVERADVFYDARRDTAQRTSRSTSAASLQISWKLLLERVDDFLDPLGEAPVFLYVNIVDTHYPYHHSQLDPLLPGEPVDRSTIRAYNREQVWRTYENTAANVDRAAKEVVNAFRRAIGNDDHIILVTADHGQAFYEKGALGHGHELDRDQTQVPLIVWGGGGRWPEPIGAADLRGLLLGALDAARPSGPRFEVEPSRRVFQYLPNLERPDRIAFRRADGSTIYDFELDRAHTEDGHPLPEDSPEVIELIQTWEMLRVRTEGSPDESGPPAR